MKRIISLSLAALLLVTLLLTATACGMGMESMTGYTRLRDHVSSAPQGTVELDGKSLGFVSVKLYIPVTEGEAPDEVHLLGEGASSSGPIYLTLVMNGSPEKAQLFYRVVSSKDQSVLISADATILLNQYTGNDPIAFDSLTNIHPSNEQDYSVSVMSMLNCLLMVLDGYTTQVLDMNTHELGFTVLSPKYMAPVESTEAEEDLGGPFSVARLIKAGLMLLQGMGMVFLVLAILWIVLILFKKIFYKDEAKKSSKKAQETKDIAPVTVEPTQPVAPAPTDDGQLIAVITAAVAAAIESDEDLSNQFAGGFRVVSFKKKNGKTSWNH